MGLRVSISTDEAFPAQNSRDEVVWAIVEKVAEASPVFQERLQEAADDQQDTLKDMLLAYVRVCNYPHQSKLTDA